MVAKPSDNTPFPVYAEDHVQGPGCAPFTLIQYGDYKSSTCRQLFEIVRGLQITMGEQLRIVYRHYPLSGIHPEAQEAAEAAEAAGAQGQFWEMHHLLFQNQNALKQKDLVSYGEALGLSIDRFRKDLRKRVYRERVREDFRRGVQNNVFKPPALFLNGVRHHEISGLRRALQRFPDPLAASG